jgi:hypothetical protein
MIKPKPAAQRSIPNANAKPTVIWKIVPIASESRGNGIRRAASNPAKIPNFLVCRNPAITNTDPIIKRPTAPRYSPPASKTISFISHDCAFLVSISRFVTGAIYLPSDTGDTDRKVDDNTQRYRSNCLLLSIIRKKQIY